jgi:hypothetical protein
MSSIRSCVSRFALAGAALLALAGPASAATQVFDFSTSPFSSGQYGYGADQAGHWWQDGHVAATAANVTFTGMAGVQANAAAWGFPTLAGFSQTAFLQSYRGGATSPGSIDLNLGALTAGQTYTVTFFDAGRPGSSYGAAGVTASYGGSVVDHLDASAISTTAFTKETFTFVAKDGATVLTFSADASSAFDVSTALGDIMITGPDAGTVIIPVQNGPTTIDGGGGVPEPAAWSLMVLGVGGMGGMLRARRRKALAA